jgi:UDP-N-acetylglucosamine--N-acetylmuramyl-(pentapeptide) pyrophosphoryl-undecaprenol N-acetylglucosamine transferase
MSQIIYLTGGGTAGHLFPAISVAQELQKRGCSTYIVTDKRCQKYLAPQLNIPTIVFTLGSISGSYLEKISTLIRIGIAFLVMCKKFYSAKPDLVIGFGGYASLPTLLAAMLFKIEVVIHEQNCPMGKVNRYFLNYASLIALNFKATAASFDAKYYDVAVIGNPIRQEITSQKFDKDFSTAPFTILIIGGSQGASVFDQLIPQAISIIAAQNKAIKVIQQVSAKSQQSISQTYQKLGITAEVNTFFSDISSCYAQAHVAICRSGAGTIAELIHVGLPAIFIPLPTAAANHQFYNAQALSSTNAAICLHQKDLTPLSLANELAALMNNTNELESMHQKLLLLRNNSSRDFADLIMELLSRQ